MERIELLAGGRPVAPTDALGVPTAHVESMAFAWLAMKCVSREAIDLTSVTGRPRAAHPGRHLPRLEREGGAEAPSVVHAAADVAAMPQTVKEEPQPQVDVAFGFLITNCAPSSPSV